MRGVMVRLSLVLMLLFLIVWPSYAGAAGEPKRDVVFYADYTSIGVAAGQEVSLDVTLDNKGEVAEDVDLSITTPENWEATLTAWATKDAQIRSMHLEPAQEQPKKLTLKTTVPKDASTGNYTITIEATTQDLTLQRSIDFAIEVLEAGTAYTGPATVELAPDYPSLGAVPDGSIEFKIEVANKSGEDKTFDFAAEVPAHVEAQFSPAFDRGKTISSLVIEAGVSQSIIMKLSIAADVEQGTYPIVFKAASGEVSGTARVQVKVTAKGELRLGSLDEKLSAKATAGKKTKITIYAVNQGKGPVENVSFSTQTKPDEWSVEFEPKEIAYIEPNSYKPVEVTIIPKGKAIAGDYRVQLRGYSPGEGSDMLEYRIRVETSSSGLVIGVIIVVVVLAVLIGVFLILRRR